MSATPPTTSNSDRPDPLDLLDLIVVGGGPAGAATAIRAAQIGLNAALFEQHKQPPPRPCGGWVSPAGIELCAACGVGAADVGAAAFDAIGLHSWDFRKRVAVKERELHGWIVDRARLDAALLGAAAAAGARVVRGVTATGLTLFEDHAVLSLANGDPVRGRLIVLADGVDSPMARAAGLTPAGRLTASATSVYAEYSGGTGEVGLDIVLGVGAGAPLGTIARDGATTRVSVLLRGPGRGEELFATMTAGAEAAGLLPGAPRRIIESTTPGGLALDIESHVGKRCLMVGDAGGFVAAFSNEGIYPAMKSGWLAAETARDAAHAPLPQDVLAEFGARWRGVLADYLRMPNTDLSLLLPLIFSNAQMSKRVAQAFLLGRKF
ncbi:MAG: NAD(P)/FAD-dependent oxidoreductase [Phycisphaerae bacterium]